MDGAGARGGFGIRTGVITTDAGDAIGPTTLRSAFERSPLAADAQALVFNGPWRSWSVERAIGARPFGIQLFFHDETLWMVVLALLDPQFGRSWDDFTQERELARKAAHEAWLAAADPAIGEAMQARWGFVQSTIDPKNAGAEIVIRYGASLPPAPPVSPIRFAGNA